MLEPLDPAIPEAALPLDFVVTKANRFSFLTEASLSWGFHDNCDSRLIKRQKKVFHDALPTDMSPLLLSSRLLVSVLYRFGPLTDTMPCSAPTGV